MTAVASERPANPFRGGAVGGAWDGGFNNDVDSIHRSAFETCCEAVNSVRKLRQSAAVTIHGAAGSGKTHLVRRLRTALTAHFSQPSLRELQQVFAYVRLDTTPSALARHVRRNVAADLMRKSGRGLSQFEMMVISHLMHTEGSEGDLLLWWEHFRDERLDEVEELLAEFGAQEGISSTFIRVLSHFVARRHRLDVAAWLRGESLTKVAYDRLGIVPVDDIDPEQEAMDVLRDFARLAGDNLPLVMCFDQVEALQTRPGDTDALFAFGQLMRNLHNADENLVLISCMQSSLFTELETAIPSYQQTALSGYAVRSLEPLKEPEARLLLSSRLQLIRPSSGDDLRPLTDDEIRAWCGPAGTTPRRLLYEAARRFDDDIVPPTDWSIKEWLSSEWDRYFQQGQQASTSERSGETLRNSLEDLLLVTEPDWKVHPAKRRTGLEYVLEEPHGEARIGVAILENSNYRLPRQLASIVEATKSDDGLHKLVMLRDERCPISEKAAVTRRRLDELERNDAPLHWVAPEVYAALEAVRELLASARAGDLSFEGNSVTPQTVIEWLKDNLPAKLVETAEALTGPTPPPPPPPLMEKLQAIMVRERVLSLSDAAGRLNVGESEVRSVAENRPDLVGVIDGDQTALFSVRSGSRCLHASIS